MAGKLKIGLSTTMVVLTLGLSHASAQDNNRQSNSVAQHNRSLDESNRLLKNQEKDVDMRYVARIVV